MLHDLFPYNVSHYLKGKSTGNLYKKMAKLTRDNFQSHGQVFIDIPHYINKISDEFLEGFLGEILSESHNFTDFKNRVQIRTSIHTLGEQIHAVYKRVMTSKRRQDQSKLDCVGEYIAYEEIISDNTEVVVYNEVTT